jgi:hypothetical protein
LSCAKATVANAVAINAATNFFMLYPWNGELKD